LGLPASTGIRTQYFGMQTCHRSANPLGVEVHQRESLTQMKIRQTVITTFEKCVLTGSHDTKILGDDVKALERMIMLD
jgi:hypothetical protein